MATVEVIGDERLIARLIRMKEALNPAAVKSIRRVAEEVRDYAKTICPVGTPESTGIPGYIGGSLKKSGRVGSYARPAKHVFSIRVTFGGYITNPNTKRKVDYAKYVHEGTSKMTPRPFLLTSIMKHRESLAKAIKEEIKE